MEKHPLPYARPEYQVTLMTRISKFLLNAIAKGGWILLGFLFIVTITTAAWFIAGYIAERPRPYWWAPRPTYAADVMFGQLAGYIGLMLAVLLLVVWGRWRREGRVRRATLLLAQLRMAVSMNLPLAATLAGATQGESGRGRRQLMAMREAIEGGSSISAAVMHAAPELPPRIIQTLAAAEHNGMLEPALNRLLDEQHRRTSQDVTNFATQRLYAMIVFLMAGGILMTIVVFLLPRFEQILHDFHLAPPTVVLWAKSFVNDIWPFVAFVIVWILLLMMAGNAAQALFMLRPGPSMWRVLVDWLKWSLPVTHGFERDRGLADVCELLADGLENGRPAASALQTAILPNINRALAAKLSRWQIMLELGQPLHQAAAEVGLPPLMVALLAPAPFTAGVADALRFLSRYYRDRNERLLILLRALFTPASTLALGWLVLITALVVFGTMVVLDQSLSGGTHHEWVVRP